ncbi:FGGY-family carbohydrate kinase [Rhodococcus sp. OK519]|uniref:FGGY-family carbohydrate kinase n=1 Tax=Rhodococcus sp. OK519 TaxID=2135729 RepID=UPI002158AE1C
MGSGFVRMVCLRESSAVRALGGAERRTILVDNQDPVRLAGESIGVLLADDAESGTPAGVTIAYTDEGQAAALDSAMRREGITRYRLVPELSAVLAHLGATGLLTEFGTVVVCDLGTSGTTVSVVETSTGRVAATERTSAGLEESVVVADELLLQSGSVADAVVLIGGGAHIDSVRELLADLAGLPVVVPDDPEFSAASGAALIGSRDGALAAFGPTPRSRTRRTASSHRGVSRRQLRGAGAAGIMLALLAVIGFGLGYGRTIFDSSADARPRATVTSTPAAASTLPSAPAAVPVQAPPMAPLAEMRLPGL